MSRHKREQQRKQPEGLRYLGYNLVPVGGLPYHDERVAALRSRTGHEVVDIGIGDRLAPTYEEEFYLSETLAHLVQEGRINPGATKMGVRLDGRDRDAYVFWRPDRKGRIEVGTRQDFELLGPNWVKACDELDTRFWKGV